MKTSQLPGLRSEHLGKISSPLPQAYRPGQAAGKIEILSAVFVKKVAALTFHEHREGGTGTTMEDG